MSLRQPDKGSVRVLGLDPQKQRQEVSQRIGIQLQQASLPERLKVWEALDLYSTFYSQTVPWEPLLEQWGLTEKRNAKFDALSGGQKQRLFIALALLNDPEVVFLDELTTGLDPQARCNTWEMVRTVRDQGKPVVLVTHFMDEAEELCDRLAIIDRGNVIALDTPQNLIQDLGAGNRVVFEDNGAFNADMVSSSSPMTRVERNGNRVVVHGQGDGLITAVVAALEKHKISFKNLRTEQPDLEDVFIALTGRQIRA
ncbi:Efflux ABC transporter, ATP-binding protein [hydrothermal vent metagenome]|uniref:Efflux ABC transporter, ATP-binding protein n=1 Tax=hydrothermal vent metagenome TaxID=652676 RepID=A0A3B0UZT5_9ZZZZ